jgi:DNA-binding transcriptional LysR family regulator
MEVHQLRYFVAVVDEGSFTRAAARVNVSQSGVSAQIRQLERELGQPLIDRSDRRITLTDAGEAVLPHARAVLSALTAIREATDEVAGLLRGGVRIGLVSGCSLPWFLDALADVHRTHPRLSLTLTEGSSELLQQQVLTADLNLALVGYAGEPVSGLDSACVVDESLMAAVPPGHPLATRASIRLADLDRETVICMTPGTGIRAAFDLACRSLGSPPRVDLEASAPETVAGLAVRGLGVAVLSASMVANRPDLVGLPVIPPANCQLGLVWRAGATPSAATQAVLGIMKTAFP